MVYSIEYNHPCTIHVKLYATGEQHEEEDITEFSLELVSPIDYLFRKFSANEFSKMICTYSSCLCTCMHIFPVEMSDKISQKMTSALLAMSLSYYYVMGEHVEKEARTDEILSTLLNCSRDKMHTNTKQTTGKYTVSALIFKGLYFMNYPKMRSLQFIFMVDFFRQSVHKIMQLTRF